MGTQLAVEELLVHAPIVILRELPCPAHEMVLSAEKLMSDGSRRKVAEWYLVLTSVVRQLTCNGAFGISLQRLLLWHRPGVWLLTFVY